MPFMQLSVPGTAKRSRQTLDGLPSKDLCNAHIIQGTHSRWENAISAPEGAAAQDLRAGGVEPADQQRLPLRAHRVAQPQQLAGQPARSATSSCLGFRVKDAASMHRLHCSGSGVYAADQLPPLICALQTAQPHQYSCQPWRASPVRHAFGMHAPQQTAV